MFFGLLSVAKPEVVKELEVQRLTTRGPVPEYRPDPDDPQWDDLSFNDPAWQRLDACREEAWRLGIPVRVLGMYEYGHCPIQIDGQIEALQSWIEEQNQPVSV